jgi:Family of unknown function (DUF6790)
MVNVFVALLSVLLPLVHLSLSRRVKSRRRVIYLLLLYALVFDVGIVGLIFGFIPHVFFADQVAERIGWAPGSPFQFEVGFHDGAWGLLGFLCIWIGGSFWLATGLGWSFFMIGAAYGHIVETLREGNYAPYNFLTIFTDGFIAIWLLILLYLHYRWGGFQNSDQSQD